MLRRRMGVTGYIQVGLRECKMKKMGQDLMTTKETEWTEIKTEEGVVGGEGGGEGEGGEAPVLEILVVDDEAEDGNSTYSL